MHSLSYTHETRDVIGWPPNQDPFTNQLAALDHTHLTSGCYSDVSKWHVGNKTSEVYYLRWLWHLMEEDCSQGPFNSFSGFWLWMPRLFQTLIVGHILCLTEFHMTAGVVCMHWHHTTLHVLNCWCTIQLLSVFNLLLERNGDIFCSTMIIYT